MFCTAQLFSRHLDRFVRREDGNMTVLAVGFFMCMVMIGGFAADMMHHEADRPRLQNTLDRGVLAAASLDQDLDAEVVANEYLTKEGLEGDLQDLDVITTNQRVSWVAWQLYARALGWDTNSRNTQYTAAKNLLRTQTATTIMDTQFQSICTQAKAQDVVVYGIAFEAPSDGQTQIEGCASSSSHYFDAQGLEIATAFRTIASNLTMLKLTQ